MWFVEDEDFDFDDGETYLGTFSGHVETRTSMGEQVEGLTAEEAIAWGRARGDVVLMRLADGQEYLSAGDKHPAEFGRWPPPEPVVRRRPAGQQWRDRTDTDAPVVWAVDLVLAVPLDTPVGEHAAAVRVRARRGLPRVSPAEVLRVDLTHGNHHGYTFPQVPHRVELDVEAPTARVAAQRAVELFVAPDSWTVEAWVRPIEQRPPPVLTDRWHVETILSLPASFARRLADELRALLNTDPRFAEAEVHARRRGEVDLEFVVAAPDDGAAEVAADAALTEAMARASEPEAGEVGWTQEAWEVTPSEPSGR